MSLHKYIFKRLLLMIPALFGITLICFVIINIAPGGPIEQKLQQIRLGSVAGKGSNGIPTSSGGSSTALSHYESMGVSEEVLEAMKRQYGFDKPVLERYWLWLKNIAVLDFGESFTYNKPVTEVIKSRLPVSIQFGVSSLILTYIVSFSLGIIMAKREGLITDKLLIFSLLASTSIPAFVLAILLLVFLAGGSFLDLFPLGYLHSEFYEELSFTGKILDRIHHFVLPLTAYVFGSFASLSLLTRNTLSTQLKQEYVTVARSKGLKESTVIIKHAFRNAMIPLVTGIGGVIGIFLSGSLLIETIFQLQGIGLLGYSSVISRDYNVVMALIFIQSVLMLLGNLIGDLIYMLVDPRIDFK